MGEYSLTKGGYIDIDLADDIKDNGWTVENGYAVHHGCNSGNILLDGFPYIPGIVNKFRYTVEGRTSGMVRLSVGNVNGPSVTTNGDFVNEFTPAANDSIAFYSDGNLKIKVLSISAVTSQGQGITVAFSEKYKKWVTYYDYKPEYLIGFKDNLFVAQAGQIWLQNSNPIRNNFMGVQYSSKVVFYVNINPKTVKDFFSIFINSNKPWAVVSAFIHPTEGKSQGQLTRIKTADFTKIADGWFADFKRNMLDPRFPTQLEALMYGSEMQGKVMEITLENKDTTEVRLVSVDVETQAQNFTH